MSKMSQLYAELTAQAAELGFGSIEEAEANGYAVNYEKQKLEHGQELAHREWLARRSSVLSDLFALKEHFVKYEETQYATIIEDTIKFIEEGEV